MSTSEQKSSSNSERKTRQTTMGNYTTSEKGTRSKRHDWGYSVSNFTSSFFANASKRDTEQYRKGYPGKKDNLRQKDNLLFYTNQMASYPDGDYINNIHKKWWGDYGRLETHHGYIQWIFPIRESGMNWHAQELQLHEAKAIMRDPEAKERVLKSYKMMLDFYGIELEDVETGRIVRGEDYKERFAHLNRSYHNYLRITRMLKSLGELGYEHLKKPFVEFVLEEALERETLTNCVESCYKYWLETIKDDKDRANLKDYVEKMEAGYGTKYPPVDDMYDSDEMNEEKDKVKHGNYTDNMYDEDSLEARHLQEDEDRRLQEEEDRLIAMNEQFKEDMLHKGNDNATEERMDVDNDTKNEQTVTDKDTKMESKTTDLNDKTEESSNEIHKNVQKSENSEKRDDEQTEKVGDLAFV